MKLTRKQIFEIMNHTPANLKHTHATIEDPLGYFTPSGANWSYRAGWTREGVLVVVRFGEIQ